MDDKQSHDLSDEQVTAGKGASANGLGLGLVLVGAVAMAIAVFLPFAQPVDGLPILGKNTLFQLIGWHVLWPPFLIAAIGPTAGQGQRSARWSLIGLCAIAAVGVVALASDKDLRTMHVIGPGGAADSTGPGILAGLGIAIYVAGAGVAIAIVGALALFQNARKESRNGGSTAQRTVGLRETPVLSASEGNPQPEQAVLEAEASAEGAGRRLPVCGRISSVHAGSRNGRWSRRSWWSSSPSPATSCWAGRPPPRSPRPPRSPPPVSLPRRPRSRDCCSAPTRSTPRWAPPC